MCASPFHIYGQTCRLNAYAGVLSNTSNDIFRLVSRIHIYLVFVGKGGSGKSAHMLRFVSALGSRKCDLFQIIMFWPFCSYHGDL